MHLNKNSTALRITLQIGKKGLTEELILELKKQLKKRKIVKIKLLRSFLCSNDKREAALELSRISNSEIIDITGFTIVLGQDLSANLPAKQQGSKSKG